MFWIVFLIALAFVLGWGPQELRKRNLEERLEQTELDLRLANLHRQIGMASHEAQRNNFAAAATQAGAFFDGCQRTLVEYELKDRPRTRLALSAYPQSADTILGELAVGDPAVKQRLASLYLTMDGVLQRRQ